jgi:squalene synthase HpnC
MPLTASESSRPGASRSAGWQALPPDYAIPAAPPTLAEAEAYCERLARSHYENFSVATWFLPQRLRPHFHSIYAYCRIADDLGDEVGNSEQSLQLLDEWEEELTATYASLARPEAVTGAGEGGEAARSMRAYTASPRHPVFVALRETIRACDIPREPFADLLQAFRQDQRVSRYQSFDDVLGYCRYSANPVGRLVLYSCGYRDAERQQLSDFTCTALQLANFWQDVARDYAKGRIYLPLEDMRRFGVGQEEIARGAATAAFRELMAFEVERAREWFGRGLPLAGKVDRELAVDIELFSRGGLAILDAISAQNYDVLTRRPVVSKRRKLALLARAALRKWL